MRMHSAVSPPLRFVLQVHNSPSNAGKIEDVALAVGVITQALSNITGFSFCAATNDKYNFTII